MENDKNAELKEILAKRKVEREKNQKPKQENISITKAEKFRAEKEKMIEQEKKNNPNFRDYDENPLIINCYDEIFIIVLPLLSLLLGILLLIVFYEIYARAELNIKICIIYLCIYFGCLVIKCLIHNKYFFDYKIKFTNNYIDFIHNGKVKKSCPVIKDELARPFFVYADGKTKNCLIAKIFVYITQILIFIASLGFIFLANILIKAFIYLYLNGNLKGFKAFPFIRVCSQNLMHNIYGAHLIYFYNDKVYLEVKKYFLQKNIDIDDLPNSYVLA